MSALVRDPKTRLSDRAEMTAVPEFGKDMVVAPRALRVRFSSVLDHLHNSSTKVVFTRGDAVDAIDHFPPDVRILEMRGDAIGSDYRRRPHGLGWLLATDKDYDILHRDRVFARVRSTHKHVVYSDDYE